MSREIKFRAWNKKRKFYLYEVETKGFESYVRENGTEQELEQYTGLKDKNGKEIYEGDTVKQTVITLGEPVAKRCGTGKIVYDYNRYVIEVDWARCRYVEITGYDTGRYCEVLGNIHENPELLEKEK